MNHFRDTKPPAPGTSGIEGQLSLTPPPHYSLPAPYTRLLTAYITVSCAVLAVGVAVHGPAAAWIATLSVTTALLVQLCARLLGLAAGRAETTDSVLIGLLMALTLPVEVSWHVPVVGAAIAIAIGKVVFGGVGHYFWHPVVVGRAFVELLLSPPGAEDVLHDLAQGQAHLVAGPEHPLVVAVRDALPPWDQTLLGVAGDGIGEGAAAVLLVATVYLIHRQCLRWQMVAGVLAGAAAAALVLPLPVNISDGLAWRWMPGLACPDGLTVGPVYVLYHLTSGELMLVACLLAGETVTSPLTSRGQLVFALGLGALAVFLRMYGVASCAGYWALLAMNTLTPAIDRATRVRARYT